MQALAFTAFTAPSARQRTQTSYPALSPTQVARRLGVDRVVQYRMEDLGSVLRDEYPSGIDLAYEGVGGPLLGAICANLAWLTVWPGDVVKTQRQSGNYDGVSSLGLLKENIATGRLYKGVLPGLARSTIANGLSMVVYEMTHVALSKYYGVGRKDVT